MKRGKNKGFAVFLKNTAPIAREAGQCLVNSHPMKIGAMSVTYKHLLKIPPRVR